LSNGADVEMVPVSSSNIKSIGYNAPDRTLYIEFLSGKKWKYADVSPQKHAALMATSSHGKHFVHHIRHSHTAEEY
jgi:prephenate dehydrogenase